MSIPTWLFQTTWIYHITSIDNLEGILEEGAIYSTNHCPDDDRACIANEDIQSRRATKRVPLSPNGVIHDYVPFYFAPRSPMLCANYNGSFGNAKPQDEIITLATTAQIIAEHDLPFVFFDHHAAVDFANCYNDLADLHEIDWELFFEPPLEGVYAKYWQDRYDPNHPKWLKRKAVRQAEFLVHESLDWQHISYIGTMNEARTNQVKSILRLHHDETPVETRSDWYF